MGGLAGGEEEGTCSHHDGGLCQHLPMDSIAAINSLDKHCVDLPQSWIDASSSSLSSCYLPPLTQILTHCHP